ncbi:SGNH/GDSL hydrolase family protein [Kocuria sp. KH4]
MQHTPRPVSRRRRKTFMHESNKLVNWSILGLCAALVAGGGALALQNQRAAASVSEATVNYTLPPMDMPEEKSFAVIGDSFTGGSGQGGVNSRNWVPKAALLTMTEDIEVVGIKTGLGGSGYVNRGPNGNTFIDVIDDTVSAGTDVIMFFGSTNDLNHPVKDVREAAAAAYAKTTRDYPDATLVVSGPVWTDAESRDQDPNAMIDALEEEAERAGAVWIDPWEERWFEDAPELIGDDDVHPDDQGHTYMAEKFAEHLGPLLR